jgi:hypothetical protein
VFDHGVGGIGPLVFARSHGVGGIGPLVLASVAWVASAFRPTALVKTSNTKTATINHLFIDPPEGNYPGRVYRRSDAIKGVFIGNVSKRYTPPPPWQSQSFSYCYKIKIAFGGGRVNVTKVLVSRLNSLMLRSSIRDDCRALLLP